MNFEYLREFLDLASTLNFTKSASNLHMTQSTLSRHISAMEKEIGAPLFTRSTSKVKLTQNGRLLYERSSALLNDYADAIEEMKAEISRAVETLSVSGSAIQPTVLRLFSMLSARASFEKLPIRFEFHKMRSLSNEPPAPYPVDALRDGDVDLIIDPCEKGAQPPRGMAAIELCDEPVTVLCGTSSVLAGAVDFKIEDLLSESVTVFAVQQHCARILSSAIRSVGYSSQRVRTIFVDNMLEIPERLGQLEDDEIVFMQSTYCRLFGFDQCMPEGVTTLDVRDDRLRTSVWCLYRKNDDSPSVQAAVQLVRDLVDEAKMNAADDDWSDANTVLNSAFYRAGRACR